MTPSCKKLYRFVTGSGQNDGIQSTTVIDSRKELQPLACHPARFGRLRPAGVSVCSPGSVPLSAQIRDPQHHSDVELKAVGIMAALEQTSAVSVVPAIRKLAGTMGRLQCKTATCSDCTPIQSRSARPPVSFLWCGPIGLASKTRRFQETDSVRRPAEPGDQRSLNLQ